MEGQPLQVIVEGQQMQLPSEFTHVSEYLMGLEALGFDDSDPIEIQNLSVETLKEILEFYELCEYKDVFIKTPIKTSILSEIVPTHIVSFIERHPVESKEFNSLVKGCEFLGCKNLFRVCAARVAALIYFGDSKAEFEAKQKELGVEVNVQFEDNEKFKKIYPFMNN